MARTSKWTAAVVANALVSAIASTLRREREETGEDGERPDLIADFGIVVEKTLDGEKKPRRFLNIQRLAASASIGAKTEVIDREMRRLLQSWAKPDSPLRKLFDRLDCDTNRLYKPERIEWKNSETKKFGGPMLEKLRESWNKHQGNVDKIEKDFGLNEWGENILPKTAIKPKVKAIVEELGEGHGFWQEPTRLTDEQLAKMAVAELGDLIE